jgi:hypothetical protein
MPHGAKKLDSNLLCVAFRRYQVSGSNVKKP